MRYAYMALALNFASTLAGQSIVVEGWDHSRALVGHQSRESYGFVGGAGYARARSELSSRMPGISFRSGVPEITTSALAGVDVFVVTPARSRLSSSEIAAIEGWVNAGGALLVTQNGGSAVFGVTEGAGVNEGYPTIVAPYSSLIMGPHGTIRSGLGTGYNSWFATTGGGLAVTANSAGPNVVLLGSTASRRGRAVVIGDEEIFMTGSWSAERLGKLDTHPANRVFLANVFAWLAGAPGVGGTFTALGTGCAGTYGTPQIALQFGSRVAPGQPLDIAWTGLPLTVQNTDLFMLVGFAEQTPPAAFGPLAPGCELLIVPVAAFNDGHAILGSGTWSIQLPNRTGLTFYLQAAVRDLTANPLGIVMSNAARVDL